MSIVVVESFRPSGQVGLVWDVPTIERGLSKIEELAASVGQRLEKPPTAYKDIRIVRTSPESIELRYEAPSGMLCAYVFSVVETARGYE